MALDQRAPRRRTIGGGRGGGGDGSGGRHGTQIARLANKAPTTTHIIIDACYSGGIAQDMKLLIRPEILGEWGSPALVVLAMASADQYAMESDAGGMGTNVLLECADGRLFVQEHSAALELWEIGGVVCDRVGVNPDQKPKRWALNVHEPAAFCRNPHFQASLAATFKHWRPKGFIENLEPLLVSTADEPREQVAHVDRLLNGLSTPPFCSPIERPGLWSPGFPGTQYQIGLGPWLRVRRFALGPRFRGDERGAGCGGPGRRRWGLRDAQGFDRLNGLTRGFAETADLG